MANRRVQYKVVHSSDADLGAGAPVIANAYTAVLDRVRIALCSIPAQTGKVFPSE